MAVHRSEYRVLFGDTDGMGIVYNANYLRIFEMARTEWFRSLLRKPKDMVDSDMYFVVVKAHINYHSPARYDDLLAIECWIPKAKVKRASFHFAYRVSHKDSGQIVATGYTVHALTTKEGKLKRMPKDLHGQVSCLAIDQTPGAE